MAEQVILLQFLLHKEILVALQVHGQMQIQEEIQVAVAVVQVQPEQPQVLQVQVLV